MAKKRSRSTKSSTKSSGDERAARAASRAASVKAAKPSKASPKAPRRKRIIEEPEEEEVKALAPSEDDEGVTLIKAARNRPAARGESSKYNPKGRTQSGVGPLDNPVPAKKRAAVDKARATGQIRGVRSQMQQRLAVAFASAPDRAQNDLVEVAELMARRRQNGRSDTTALLTRNRVETILAKPLTNKERADRGLPLQKNPVYGAARIASQVQTGSKASEQMAALVAKPANQTIIAEGKVTGETYDEYVDQVRESAKGNKEFLKGKKLENRKKLKAGRTESLTDKEAYDIRALRKRHNTAQRRKIVAQAAGGATTGYSAFAKAEWAKLPQHEGILTPSEARARLAEQSKAIALKWEALKKSNPKEIEAWKGTATRGRNRAVNQVKATINGTLDENGRPIKKERKPRASMSAWLVYQGEKRAAAKAEFPKATFGELTKKLAERWRNMEAEAKAVYQDKADVLNAQKKKDIAAGAYDKPSPKPKKARRSSKSPRRKSKSPRRKRVAKA